MDKFIYLDKKRRIKETTLFDDKNREMVRNILQERFLFFFWISKNILFPLPQKGLTILPDGFIRKEY